MDLQKKISKEVCVSSACYPGYEIKKAIDLLFQNKLKDKCIDLVSFKHIQVCPQNMGYLNKDTVNYLMEKYPDTIFRPHANVRTLNKLQMFDVNSNLDDASGYIYRLNRLIKWFGTQVYSWHAGIKMQTGMDYLREQTLSLQDKLKIKVAVEGLYPTNKKQLMLSSIEEYEYLLSSDIYFAIDLSHLQILAKHLIDKNISLGKFDEEKSTLHVMNLMNNLTKSLLEHKNCLEIHISDNDLVFDSHRLISSNRWWMDILNTANINSDAVIFTESDQRDKSRHNIF